MEENRINFPRKKEKKKISKKEKKKVERERERALTGAERVGLL
jgi:hypothetical protein